MPLTVLSQTAVINRNNETVVLDKLKTIDVAKIIVNEQRLRSFLDSLEVEVTELQKLLELQSQNAVTMLDKIKSLNMKNQSLTNEILDLRAQEVETEKPREKTSLYFLPSASGNAEGFESIHLGGALNLPGSLFTFQVDPFLSDKLVYQIGVGFKLF